MLHLNEQSVKSAGRSLQIHTGSGESCSGPHCVWENTPLPLPVLDEVDFKKVAEKQSNLKERWRRNTVLSFCATSSSAEE